MSGIELPFVFMTVDRRVNGPEPSPYIESFASMGNLGVISYYSIKVPMPMSIAVG